MLGVEQWCNHILNQLSTKNHHQMKLYRLTVLLLLFISTSACEQHYITDQQQGQSASEKKVKDALIDTTGHNCVNHKRIIIKNEEIAINVVEPILFDMYGEENILDQRPYKVSKVKDYWLIEGSLPKGSLGGTFLIIVDARNAEIIKITHGK